MSFEISIQVDISNAQQKLVILGRMLDTQKLLQTTGFSLLDWVDKNFKTEGGMTKRGWPPLSPNTIVGRRGGGKAILSGLRQKFESSYGPDWVAVGSVDPRVYWHHFGTRGPYEIKPRFKKALAFQVSGTGGERVRRLPMSPQGKARAQFEITWHGLRTPARKSSRGGLNMAVVKSIQHPGLPARPMLPTLEQGRELAWRTLNAYVEKVTRQVNAGG